LNDTTLMFMAGVAVLIFCLAICISWCIIRRYTRDKHDVQSGKFLELGPDVAKGEAFTVGQPANDLDG